MNTFGQRLRFARERLGLNQDQVATAAGYKDFRAVQAIEAGRSLRPTRAVELATAVGVRVEWLNYGTGEMEQALQSRYSAATKDVFDGYTVECWLDDEGDWLARFEEMPNVSAFAATPEGAIAELAEAWAGVKESYAADGQCFPVAPSRRRYSGQFNVRIDRKLHRQLAMEAGRLGISLNALVAKRLAGA